MVESERLHAGALYSHNKSLRWIVDLRSKANYKEELGQRKRQMRDDNLATIDTEIRELPKATLGNLIANSERRSAGHGVAKVMKFGPNSLGAAFVAPTWFDPRGRFFFLGNLNCGSRPNTHASCPIVRSSSGAVPFSMRETADLCTPKIRAMSLFVRPRSLISSRNARRISSLTSPTKRDALRFREDSEAGEDVIGLISLDIIGRLKAKGSSDVLGLSDKTAVI